jgi:hypothetical protein
MSPEEFSERVSTVFQRFYSQLLAQVEMRGLEPLASALQRRRSPS